MSVMQDIAEDTVCGCYAKRRNINISDLIRNVPENIVYEALSVYLLSPEEMWEMGYPMKVGKNSDQAIMWINPPSWSPPVVFLAGGQETGTTTSRQSIDGSAHVKTTDGEDHVCARCRKTFQVASNGKIVVEEFCSFHWGRCGGNESRYLCCEKPYGSAGCAWSISHVPSPKAGIHGPVEGFVHTRSPKGGVYGIDTEMIYTAAGLELAKIVVINIQGEVIYETLVKPALQVIDHNTRFSGIRPRDLAQATKTLGDVQNDLLRLFGKNTVLIGHAIENDLRAIKLVHGKIVDTCALYPHARGLPLRRSLRSLVAEILGRTIQESRCGHSALEDAQAAVELALKKVYEQVCSRFPSVQ